MSKGTLGTIAGFIGALLVALSASAMDSKDPTDPFDTGGWGDLDATLDWGSFDWGGSGGFDFGGSGGGDGYDWGGSGGFGWDDKGGSGGDWGGSGGGAGGSGGDWGGSGSWRSESCNVKNNRPDNCPASEVECGPNGERWEPGTGCHPDSLCRQDLDNYNTAFELLDVELDCGDAGGNVHYNYNGNRVNGLTCTIGGVATTWSLPTTKECKDMARKEIESLDEP